MPAPGTCDGMLLKRGPASLTKPGCVAVLMRRFCYGHRWPDDFMDRDVCPNGGSTTTPLPGSSSPPSGERRAPFVCRTTLRGRL
jgi:hypothetical protein